MDLSGFDGFYFDNIAVDGHLDDAESKVFPASVFTESETSRQSF